MSCDVNKRIKAFWCHYIKKDLVCCNVIFVKGFWSECYSCTRLLHALPAGVEKISRPIIYILIYVIKLINTCPSLTHTHTHTHTSVALG